MKSIKAGFDEGALLELIGDTLAVQESAFFLAQRDFQQRVLMVAKLYPNLTKEPSNIMRVTFESALFGLSNSNSVVPFSVQGKCEDGYKAGIDSCQDTAILTSLGCSVGIAFGWIGAVGTIICVEIMLDARDNCIDQEVRIYEMCKQLEKK